jgi:transposase
VWIRSYREECQTNDEAKSEYELMQEVRRLRKQLEEAEKENRFLKKQRHSSRRKSISGLSIHFKASERI